MPRRDYEGNAVPTTLTAPINATDLAIAITASGGWPSGGGNGKFFVTVDRGKSNEERILVSSRTGLNLTVAAIGDRGQDGTSAASHTAGATIEHTFSSVDADEANAHLFDTSRDDHTQYLNDARHDVEARHAFGAALGTPGAPAAIGTAAAAGTGDDAAREDHVHIIGAGAINSAAMLGPDVVTQSAIAPNSVGNSEMADLAVGTTELIDNAVTAAKLADLAIDDENQFAPGIAPIIVSGTDPGAVGGNRLWFNTSKGALLRRNGTNTEWHVWLDLSNGTDYTPALTGISIGTGGMNVARYRRNGNMVVVDGVIKLGTGGNVTSAIGITLPVQAINMSGIYPDDNFYFHGYARATDVGPGTAYTGVGVIGVGGEGAFDPNKLTFISSSGASGGGWNTTLPFNWDIGDEFSWHVEYIPNVFSDANYIV